MPSRELFVTIEDFPLARAFTISRGTKTDASVIVCTIRQGAFIGRGECVPYARYGETLEGVAGEIEEKSHAIDIGLTREELRQTMKAGAARNALDCALWDLEAKISNKAIVTSRTPLNTVYTLSLDTPEMMVEQAVFSQFSNFKVKLGGKGDDLRLKALRENLPHASFIIDANEGWNDENLVENIALCAKYGVSLIEQPLRAGKDEALRHVKRLVPICADESLHTSMDLESLKGKYDAVNIKLDKSGGLTEALHLKEQAIANGFQIMVGCMVSSSLSMAPAFHLAQGAKFIDLDGPLLLKEDRAAGIIYEGTLMYAPSRVLWG